MARNGKAASPSSRLHSQGRTRRQYPRLAWLAVSLTNPLQPILRGASARRVTRGASTLTPPLDPRFILGSRLCFLLRDHLVEGALRHLFTPGPIRLEVCQRLIDRMNARWPTQAEHMLLVVLERIVGHIH